MQNTSKETTQIFETIKKYGAMRSSEITKILGVSTKTVYKHLSRLLDDQLIKKTGITPRVFYSIKENIENNELALTKNDEFIQQNYIYVSADGEIYRGVEGFQLWCEKNHFNYENEKHKYVKKLRSIQKLKKNGLISAKKIILSGKKQLFLDNIFFSEFYTIDYFGKTKLGQLVYLGKSSQNKELIMEITKIIKPALNSLTSKYNIKYVSFIPPTVDRKVQILDILKKYLKLNLKEISTTKVPSLTKIPQKTLRKLDDRIINARKTIAVNPNQIIDSNILLIDDATGSGATLNETAKKFKNISKKGVKVFGYSIVGSYKGFDVISEV